MEAPETPIREDADIESSSDRYAVRFSGPVGAWFLDVQARITLDSLASLRKGASVLDVGGGHAQVAPALIEAGFDVTVAGSHPTCAARLRPWIDRGACQYYTADLLALPFPDQQFDAVVCYRLIAHSVNWNQLIGELCRVARRRVILDYPSRRSLNLISDGLFLAKRRIEGGSTRRYLLFAPRQIRLAFERYQFQVVGHTAQFLLPMVLHRLIGSATFSRVAEVPGRLAGLTQWLGSPVIVRADRAA